MESMKEGVKRMRGPGRMLAAVLLICAVFALSSCMDKTAEEVSLTPEELQDFQEGNRCLRRKSESSAGRKLLIR